MNLEIWSLYGSAFHFGEQGLGQEKTRACWSSDSLFAALIARLAALKGAAGVENWMKPFLENRTPFLLTSLFPFAGEVYFFPVPLAAALPDGRPMPENVQAKDLKKVQFVSERLYRLLLSGSSLLDILPQRQELHGGRVWLTAEEQKALPPPPRKGEPLKIWHIEKRPRVTIDRVANTSNLFHTGAVHFAPGCGLWFGVQWMEAATDRQLFEQLLYDLGEAGLGAERSVGYGKGTFQKRGVLDLPDPKTMWTSLSRYLPRQAEMGVFDSRRAAWRVQTVGGWLDSPLKSGQRRRAINLVQEGATLQMPAGIQPPFGQIVDVRPRYRTGEEYPVPHAVYRSGLTVAVGYGGDK